MVAAPFSTANRHYKPAGGTAPFYRRYQTRIRSSRSQLDLTDIFDATNGCAIGTSILSSPLIVFTVNCRNTKMWRVIAVFFLYNFPIVWCVVCPRYPVGSLFPEQHHLYSVQGLLDVRLIFMVIASA